MLRKENQRNEFCTKVPEMSANRFQCSLRNGGRNILIINKKLDEIQIIQRCVCWNGTLNPSFNVNQGCKVAHRGRCEANKVSFLCTLNLSSSFSILLNLSVLVNKYFQLFNDSPFFSRRDTRFIPDAQQSLHDIRNSIFLGHLLILCK